MPIGESYEKSPRITAQFSRTIYSELVKIADNIDFNSPVFRNRSKRNRSLGSAVAFIVELALTDENFTKRLKSYMIHRGKYYYPTFHYMDKYD